MSETKSTVSPQIESVKWGKIQVENLGTAKDIKLWPGGGRSWDWSEHGTGHSAGIQIGDCEELISNGSRTVVLSRGMFKRLKIAKETMNYLERQGVQVVVEETKKAVKHYNDLASQGKPVGGLFHTTC